MEEDEVRGTLSSSLSMAFTDHPRRRGETTAAPGRVDDGGRPRGPSRSGRVLLRAAGKGDLALGVMVFVAIAGVPESELEAVARAVLPKFFMDDVNMEAWRVFSSCARRVVVTQLPRVMVEQFAKEHLLAEEVVGAELEVSRYGFATGLLRRQKESVVTRVQALFKEGERPAMGLGRRKSLTLNLRL